MNDGELINAKKVAEILGFKDHRKVYRLMREGQLRAVTVSGRSFGRHGNSRYLFPKSEIEKLEIEAKVSKLKHVEA